MLYLRFWSSDVLSESKTLLAYQWKIDKFWSSDVQGENAINARGFTILGKETMAASRDKRK